MLTSLQKDKNGSLISDVADAGGDKDDLQAEGDPWYSYHARQESTDQADLPLINADSYVWFALESYWTVQCKDELASQNGRFDPPVED
jgi:hypothetical protein